MFLSNSGHSCNAPTRMLVEAAAYDGAVRVAAAVAEETKVAAANLSGRHIGPVVNRMQWEKIQVRGVEGPRVHCHPFVRVCVCG